MMLINKSKLPQVLYLPRKAIPVVIQPGCVFDSSPYNRFSMDFFEEFNIEKFRNAKNITVVRMYALGDVLQLIPVLREFKKFYNIQNLILITNPDYFILRRLFPEIEFISESMAYDAKYRSAVSISLDGALEKDHSITNEERTNHRMAIYLKTLGICNYNQTKFDWSFVKIAKEEILKMDKNFKYIGLQIRGSCGIKSLPYDFVKSVAISLSEKYKVVLLDYDRNKGFDGNNIINMCGKLNVPQCIELLSKLDCCITMDSGMLWMCHFANCPILTILGPTRESERISYHPLYPRKAKAINIATDIIKCEPCFETKVRCAGRINCMNNFSRDTLLKMIHSKINDILEAK